MSELQLRRVHCDARSTGARRAFALAAREALVVSVEHAKWAVRIRDSLGNILAERAVQSERSSDEKIELTLGAHHFKSWTEFAQLTVETQEPGVAHPRSDGSERASWTVLETLLVQGANARVFSLVLVGMCLSVAAFWLLPPAAFASVVRRRLDLATASAVLLVLFVVAAIRGRRTPRWLLFALLSGFVISAVSLWQTAVIDNQRVAIEGPGLRIERRAHRWARWEVRATPEKLIVRGVPVDWGPRCALVANSDLPLHGRWAPLYVLSGTSAVDIERGAVEALQLQQHATCSSSDAHARCCLATSSVTAFAPRFPLLTEGGMAVSNPIVHVTAGTSVAARYVSLRGRVSSLTGARTWRMWDERQPQLVLSWGAQWGLPPSRFAPSLLGEHVHANVIFEDGGSSRAQCERDPTLLWAAEFARDTIASVSSAGWGVEVPVSSGRAVYCGSWKAARSAAATLRFAPSLGASPRWSSQWASFSLHRDAGWDSVRFVTARDGADWGVAAVRDPATYANLVAVRIDPTFSRVRRIVSTRDGREPLDAWTANDPTSDLVFLDIDPEAQNRALMTRIPSTHTGMQVLVVSDEGVAPRRAVIRHGSDGWRLDPVGWVGLELPGPPRVRAL